MDTIKSDSIIRDLLRQKCEDLEDQLSSEVFMIRAPMAPPIDDEVRHEIENLANSDGARKQLAVILETNGGSIEVVERIADVFRHHFETVKFIIPNFAYSAGTVLSLSGDEILMDYYSVLGPIDPQIMNREGRWVPGLGYLEKYKALVEKSKDHSDPISPAEMEFLIRKFDPAELFALEQAKRHSADLIEKWLCEYKFKDWNQTETTGKEVDNDTKSKRAKDIADTLGDATIWNSHGRGIPMRVLTSDKIKLKVTDFGEDANLNRAIRDYYNLFIDYCAKIGSEVAIHTKARLLPLGG